MKQREIRRITKILGELPEGEKTVVIINIYNYASAKTQWNSFFTEK